MKTLQIAIKKVEALKDRLNKLEQLQKSTITSNTILYIDTTNITSVSFSYDDENLFMYTAFIDACIATSKNKLKPLEDKLNLIEQLL